ncbi:7-carboxy-7-deazaguanine synthase (Cx14CxxC type) [Streptomonospora nanhaiensis]|uniref:7-carboxy-7-deazaguanine synthase n=1 Tax=Streptomonospora nanhaiensis TaxID=1323731 RepID=A0A853BND4_9ACTN|nr:7-carboxy-7-deazaguanine synthase [Streptomonospora nanhaiensis]NYI97129.1 7-carboxy-7-deazaguanine synthase (Cx14CxxC type) [Streptomonospora nanhaiensis]
MRYFVKEIFYTLQGEGSHAGRPAVFCRMSRCNLWTGYEKDRHRAICKFCDTDFVGTDGVGGGRFQSAEKLADAVERAWPSESRGHRFVVCTGGEPLLQLDDAAVAALHERGFEVAVETNGTRRPPRGVDWLCVSPKIGAELVVSEGDELKLVYPQAGGDPAQFEHLDFGVFRLQPMDGPELAANTEAAVEYCLKNPRWRLSLQTHKYLGIR